MLTWIYQNAAEVSISRTIILVSMVTCNTLMHYGIRETYNSFHDYFSVLQNIALTLARTQVPL